MNYERPDLASRLAAEYQLGLMHGHARKRFERLIKTSPTIARAVAGWGDALTPLGEIVPITMKPRPQVWAAIEQRTIARPAAGHASASASVATPSTWLAGLWRAAGFAMAGVVAGIAVTQIWPLINPPPQEARIVRGLPGSYVGFLADSSGQPAVLVGQLRNDKELGIKVVRSVEVAAGSVLYLWALGPDGTPQPLGVIPSKGKGQLATSAPAEQLFSKVSELAASIEPANSTPAKPSGAFVLRGPCVKLW